MVADEMKHTSEKREGMKTKVKKRQVSEKAN